MVLRLVSSTPPLSTLGLLSFKDIEEPPRKMRRLLCDDLMPSRWTPLAVSLEDLIGRPPRDYLDDIDAQAGMKRHHRCVCGQSNATSSEDKVQKNDSKFLDNKDFKVELDVSGFKPSELILVEGRGCIIVYGEHTDAYGSKSVKSTVKLPDGLSVNQLDVKLDTEGHLVLSKKQCPERSNKTLMLDNEDRKKVQKVGKDAGSHTFSLNAAGFDPSDFKVDAVDGGVVIVGEHKDGSSMRSMALFHPMPADVNVSNGTWSKQANGMMKFLFPKKSSVSDTNGQLEGSVDKTKQNGEVRYITVNVDGAKLPPNNDSAESGVNNKRKTGGYVATTVPSTKPTEKVPPSHPQKESFQSLDNQNEKVHYDSSVDAECVDKSSDVNGNKSSETTVGKVVADDKQTVESSEAGAAPAEDGSEKLASTQEGGDGAEEAPPANDQNIKDVDLSEDLDDAAVTGDEYFVTRFELPSADPSQLRLTARDSELLLTHSVQGEVGDPKVKVTRRPLPEVDLTKMTSTWRDGTLTVMAPFLSAHSERAIPISCD